MEFIFHLIIGCGALAIFYAFFISISISPFIKGPDERQPITSYIKEGVKIYLNRQYKAIFLVGFFIAVCLFWLFSPLASIGFTIGAILSGLSAYIGIHISVRTNVGAAEAAANSLKKALGVAFKSGAVIGLLSVGLGLVGITGFYLYLNSHLLPLHHIFEALISLCFGASLISIFARLGGGIFIKGVDIGINLVNKSEGNIPQNDFCPSAVITDNVSNNVGNCGGIAADLFETYVVTLVGAMLLASLYFKDVLQLIMMLYPLMIGAACLIGSILGTFFLYLGRHKGIRHAVYKGMISTCSFSALLSSGLTYYCFELLGQYFPLQLLPFTLTNLTICLLTGLGITCLLILATEYYTSPIYKPARKIAEASITGRTTNIIQGLALSLQSTIFPIIIICLGILIAYVNAGLFGITIACMTMLSLAGMIIALEASGFVIDKAGGIVALAPLSEETRSSADALDAAGSTTKAIPKGYAIGSAGLASLILFIVYTEELHYYYPDFKVDFSLTNPFVLIGLFMGGVLSYAVASMAMQSVGKVGWGIVKEVRRQFREAPDIIAGGHTSDYRAAINLVAKSAFQQMIFPSLLLVIMPVCLYGVMVAIAGQATAFSVLGSFLIGLIVTALFLAISMTSGGGAWNNAKKYIESGHFGGKESIAHEAAIIGDIIGDPSKDTVGPALNSMIKLVSIVVLLLLAVSANL